MSLLAVKVRRDLRASWSRFVLMAIALAACLTVFGAMLFAFAAAGRETEQAYLSTEPASATIVLDTPVDGERMARIVDQTRTRPGVLEATGRTQFETAVEVNGRPRQIPLQVFAATPVDPMRVVRFDLGRPGSWPPGPEEIWFGRDGSLSLLGVAIGDTVTVQPPGGERMELRVAGTAYDPSLAPSPQEQRGHAYVSTAALATPGQPARLDQMKIQVTDPARTTPSRDRDAIVAVAGEVGTWLRHEHGLAIREIQVPKPYAHPHQWQSDVLLLSLLAGGAATLLLAAVLVATMLNTLFTRQIPQIGIMKAIGAPSVLIGRSYLAMTLAVAAVATLLAVGPALLLGRTLVGGVLAMLGIQPTSLAPAWWTYLVVVAVGLCLPLLLALIPLLKAARTTVRAAIDHHGAAAAPSAATGLLARLGRLRRLDRGLLLALRNTVRRPARFWLSVGLLAGAGMVFVAGMSLRSGTDAVEEERKAQRYWDVEVQLAAPASPDTVTDAVTLPGVTRVEAFTQVPVGVAGPTSVPVTRTYPDQGHGSIAVTTVPANAHRVSAVADGRWLGPGETGAVVLSQAVRDNTVPGLGPGDTVRLFIGGRPTSWRIAGIVTERESSEGGVYATAAGLAAATGQPMRVNRVRIITDRHDEHTRQAVATAVDTALTRSGITVEVASSVSRTEAASTGHLGPVLLVLLGIALPLGILGGIGLASTMSANILDRTREFGIMHAIGARPRTVRRIVIAEGSLLAITSCLAAALPTLGLTALLGAGLGNLFGNAALPFRISPLAVGIWLLVVVLGAVLATDAAATRASRLTVREALTYL